jgi:hypothetical protein
MSAKHQPVTYYIVVANPDTQQEHVRAAFVKKFQAENFIEDQLLRDLKVPMQERRRYTIREVNEQDGD